MKSGTAELPSFWSLLVFLGTFFMSSRKLLLSSIIYKKVRRENKEEKKRKKEKKRTLKLFSSFNKAYFTILGCSPSLEIAQEGGLIFCNYPGLF
jgi:hypothetical protein